MDVGSRSQDKEVASKPADEAHIGPYLLEEHYKAWLQRLEEEHREFLHEQKFREQFLPQRKITYYFPTVDEVTSLKVYLCNRIVLLCECVYSGRSFTVPRGGERPREGRLKGRRSGSTRPASLHQKKITEYYRPAKVSKATQEHQTPPRWSWSRVLNKDLSRLQTFYILHDETTPAAEGPGTPRRKSIVQGTSAPIHYQRWRSAAWFTWLQSFIVSLLWRKGLRWGIVVAVWCRGSSCAFYAQGHHGVMRPHHSWTWARHRGRILRWGSHTRCDAV